MMQQIEARLVDRTAGNGLLMGWLDGGTGADGKTAGPESRLQACMERLSITYQPLFENRDPAAATS